MKKLWGKICCLFLGHESHVSFSWKSGHYKKYCKRCLKDLI